MKDLFKILGLVILLINTISCKPEKPKDLKSYLENNWTSPENYIIEKFKEHDYIFVGEFHRIKHDVEFIKGIIPKLYENGIYNLAIELGGHKQQYLLDSLLKLPEFNRELAREIYYKTDPTWNFKEYIDIYEEAWKLNSKLSKKDRKFRVINLSDGYIPCGESDKVWYDVDYDKYIADIILKEIVSKNEKALIYTGINHALTKYQWPKYDIVKGSLKGYAKRTGNIVYDKVKDKSFTILLHAAWPSLDFEKLVLPVHGKIDSVMSLFDDQRVGFDLKNTPFGKLTSTNSYYKFGQENFKLEDLCDGYIFQKKFIDSEPMTLEDDYFTKDNIEEFKCFMRRLGKESEFTKSITVENANKLDEDNINKFKKQLID